MLKNYSLHSIKISKPFALLWITCVYLAIASTLYYKYGVKVAYDSPRYLHYAQNLHKGFYFDSLNFWYFSYVVLVYITQWFSAKLSLLICCQYILGYLSVLALYAAVQLFTKDKLTAFLASTVFMLFPDNLIWHSFVLTESLYSTFLCFFFYALARTFRKRSFLNYLFLASIGLLCFFCKPTAPMLFIAILIPYIVTFICKPSYRLIKVSGVLCFLCMLFFLGNQIIKSHSVMEMYLHGDIIFAMHHLPDFEYHDLFIITPPQHIEVVKSNDAQLYNMLSFMFKNPLFFIRLATAKLCWYWMHIRPFWSWTHNALVVVVLWASYYFSFVSIRKKLITTSLLRPSLLYFLLHSSIVAFTWVDWDARFFVPLYPLLAYWAALGINYKIKPPAQ